MRTIIIIPFLFLSMQASSQDFNSYLKKKEKNNFSTGYIINKDSVKIEGLIKDFSTLNEGRKYLEVVFITKEGEKFTYSPTMIKGYGVNGFTFVSFNESFFERVSNGPKVQLYKKLESNVHFAPGAPGSFAPQSYKTKNEVFFVKRANEAKLIEVKKRKFKNDMNKKQWYESLFENYGQKYDGEHFTQGTLGECDFIETELGLDKTLKILDVGCGTGRHSIELSKRGYTVTGIDLSETQLARAREKAEKEHLSIDFVKHDARNLPYQKEFDIAIMLCEGGFPLMETDELNFEILRSVSNALKQKGKFIFTTLNGLFPLYHSVEQFCAPHQKKEMPPIGAILLI
jgi:2-polyprenyl-3-methyl-5-hydroxy-6-metoxy-1,4-benzoquinol methylase